VAVNRPDLVLMVAEALVGSDGVDQLTSFDRALVDYAEDRSAPRRIDGVLLTKFDTVDDKVRDGEGCRHGRGGKDATRGVRAGRET
jgi:signal recognition particle receptor subunit alpha